jgi:hypothetical protein
MSILPGRRVMSCQSKVPGILNALAFLNTQKVAPLLVVKSRQAEFERRSRR